MNASRYPLPPEAAIARQVRERFVTEVQATLQDMAAALQVRYTERAGQYGTAREMQDWRDMMLAFSNARDDWLRAVLQRWQGALDTTQAGSAPRSNYAPLLSLELSLIGDEEVEQKIASSRLTLAVLDKVTWELNDLRLRVQRLENTTELAAGDVLKPETICDILTSQWSTSGLSASAWREGDDVIRSILADKMVEAYHNANAYLIELGIMVEIDLRPMVRRTAGGSSPGRSGADPAGYGVSRPGSLARGTAYADTAMGSAAGDPVSGSFSHPSALPTGPATMQGRTTTGLSTLIGRTAEETRMLTAGTPLARARQRAQGLLGQLRRMLSHQVADFEQTRPDRPSSELAKVLQSQQQFYAGTELLDIGIEHVADGPDVVVGDGGVVDVNRIALQLRQRTSALKQHAGTNTEKATIEIVALMFQSILAEERIPAAVRVWFARLQMPVLRLALAEPDFFSSLQHPARQLIDRMGSCVLGFDATNINGSRLEAEIKRIVQVIEQYPETGRRVFQLVLDEFQTFLSGFLTEKTQTQRVVTVAQQVEQKETLAIQYTIELRKMLGEMPVRDEVRNFLFKIWAEVLAISAVRNGAQHEQTLVLKRTATELLWSASAKPSREDRARVIQGLPSLLQHLRQGMTLMGIDTKEQDTHLKAINDTLADAFMSRTEAIPQQQIDELAQRLSNFEEVMAETGAADMADFLIDAEHIEMMLGIDASMLTVVSDGGSQPGNAMLMWARDLEVGHWYLLDHNSQLIQVQYVWRSQRRQLHLFTAIKGTSYLMQNRRLASYLQAGLLVPAEDESLTVRATRDAITKLDANPERLLF